MSLSRDVKSILQGSAVCIDVLDGRLPILAVLGEDESAETVLNKELGVLEPVSVE